MPEDQQRKENRKGLKSMTSKQSWTPSIKFFNYLKFYHNNETNKSGANLHHSLLKGGIFSKLYKEAHLICPSCYNKIMNEILGTVEMGEYIPRSR